MGTVLLEAHRTTASAPRPYHTAPRACRPPRRRRLGRQGRSSTSPSIGRRLRHRAGRRLSGHRAARWGRLACGRRRTRRAGSPFLVGLPSLEGLESAARRAACRASYAAPSDATAHPARLAARATRRARRRRRRRRCASRRAEAKSRPPCGRWQASARPNAPRRGWATRRRSRPAQRQGAAAPPSLAQPMGTTATATTRLALWAVAPWVGGCHRAWCARGLWRARPSSATAPMAGPRDIRARPSSTCTAVPCAAAAALPCR